MPRRILAATPTFAALVVFGMLSPGVSATDLSRYRTFRMGMDVSTVARQIGVSPLQARIVHRRPALIQQLEWRPQWLESAASPDAAEEIILDFYGGKLFRIAVHYDRSQTEGMTADDMIEAVSGAYGAATRPATEKKFPRKLSGEQEEVLARWQDSRYRFDLIRSSYGPSFKLIGVLMTMETDARAATLEASRLDAEEAPLREAARISSDAAAAKARDENTRLVNKPKFRP